MRKIYHFGILHIFHSMSIFTGNTILGVIENEGGIQISPELSTFGSTREIYRGIKLLTRENKATPIYIWLDSYDMRENRLASIFQKLGGLPHDSDGRFVRWELPKCN